MEHWVGLSELDMRGLLVALVGHDFGPSPEERVPEIRASRRRYAEYVADEIGIGPSDTVVDLGSGCGFGTHWIAERAAHVHACDVSPAYLNFARRECADLTNISFHHITQRNLSPLADKSVDVVVSMSVFIHFNLYDIYWYLIELARVLKPGGRLWIDFADSERINPFGTDDNARHFLAHATRYHQDPSALPGIMQWNSRASIVGMAKALGFHELAQNHPGQLRFQMNEGRIAELEADATSREGRIHEMEGLLAERTREAERFASEAAAIRASTIWRSTAPLRYLLNKLR